MTKKFRAASRSQNSVDHQFMGPPSPMTSRIGGSSALPNVS
jgi:hypothetical protein